jgi:MoaA/NifB/PqqE/SkfB family radical SAM enzyme
MQQPMTFLRRRLRPAPPAIVEELDDQIAERTLDVPRSVWIELTSRCPYDCAFCSRKTLRGHGVNMAWSLYERTVGQLVRPETIRLNYSGESSHHPRIVEAVALAAATGAWVELVSVPAALATSRLIAMVDAGLNRLTVSLHTLDNAQFKRIYGFGDLPTLLANLRAAATRRESSRHTFVLDLAFVATSDNLSQLQPIAALARELAIPVLAVHPVILRVDIQQRCELERDPDGGLNVTFNRALNYQLDRVREAFPELALQVSTPAAELGCRRPLGNIPQAWPGVLPDGAHIHSCDQDPFETLHILADGTAVTCEVRDQVSMGSLATESLVEVWRGPAMHAFRKAFLSARDVRCASCDYKKAWRPSTPGSRISPTERTAQLLYGWHLPEPTLVWSKARASLLLAHGRKTMLVLSGVLPTSAGNATNVMRIRVGDAVIGVIQNDGPDALSFSQSWPIPRTQSHNLLVVHFEVEPAFRPAADGGADVREIGFALLAAWVM